MPIFKYLICSAKEEWKELTLNLLLKLKVKKTKTKTFCLTDLPNTNYSNYRTKNNLMQKKCVFNLFLSGKHLTCNDKS